MSDVRLVPMSKEQRRAVRNAWKQAMEDEQCAALYDLMQAYDDAAPEEEK